MRVDHFLYQINYFSIIECSLLLIVELLKYQVGNKKGDLMKALEIVCACIFSENKVLIAKRKSLECDGIWEFPGGKVEENETFKEAIIREIQEELNVTIHHLHYLCSIEDHTKASLLNVHAFACKIKEGEICLTAHSTMQWIAPEKIDLAGFHGSDQPIIEACKHYLKEKSVIQ